MALVVDTGVLLAAHVTDEADHHACRALLADATEPLVIPAPVLVELEYLFRARATLRAWLDFVKDVAAGAYTIFPLDPPGLLAIARMQERYADLPLGSVDAAVFCACVALGERKVATLDHRHFSILSPARGVAFELLP